MGKNCEPPIMSMREFKIGLLDKYSIPGLLFRSDENGYYSIGIKISEDEVVKVSSATEDNIFEKVQYWSKYVDEIQERYKAADPVSGNIT